MWFSRPDPHRRKVGSIWVRAFALVILMPPFVLAIMLLPDLPALALVTFDEAVLGLAIVAGIIMTLCVLCWVLFELGFVRIENLEESDESE